MKNNLLLWSIIFILVQTLGWFSILDYKEQELKLLVGFIGALLLIINSIVIKQGLNLKAAQIILTIPIIFICTTSILFSDYKNYHFYYYLSIQAISFLLASIFILIEKNWDEKIKLLAQIIIVLTLLISFVGFIELFIFKKQAGRFLSGQQNISAVIALISMPSISYLLGKDKSYLNIAYQFLVILVILFLFRSRFALILSIIYISAYIYSTIKCRKLYKIGITFFVLLSLLILAINDSRFSTLLTGNDIYIRYYGYERFIKAIVDKFFLGYGLGTIHKIDAQYQNINPEIEILTGVFSFFSSHNDLLDKFVVGGLATGIIYIIINGYIFFAGLMRIINKKCDNAFIYIFITYLILLLQSLVDIHASNFNSLLLIYLFQALILYSLVNVSLSINKFSGAIIHIIFLLPVIFLIILKPINYVEKYNRLIQGIVFKLDISSDLNVLNTNIPHFSRLDTINQYNYLFNTPKENFNEKEFLKLTIHAKEFNRYYRPQIHLTSQFLSATQNQSELLKTYADIFYILSIENRYQTIANSSNVLLEISNEKFIYFESFNNKISILIPVELFNILIKVNSSMGSLHITDEYIDKTILSARGKNSLPLKPEEKYLLNLFFKEINSFARPVIFNK